MDPRAHLTACLAYTTSSRPMRDSASNKVAFTRVTPQIALQPPHTDVLMYTHAPTHLYTHMHTRKYKRKISVTTHSKTLENNRKPRNRNRQQNTESMLNSQADIT